MSSEYLNGRKIRRSKQVQACSLNALSQVRNNPLTTAALDSTAKGAPTDWLGVKPLTALEIQLDWVESGTDGAIPVHRSKNRTSSWFPAGTLLAEWPALRVEKGYVRHLKWRIEDDHGRKTFVVAIVEQPVVPTKKPPRKAGPSATATEAPKATKKSSSTASPSQPAKE